MNSVTVVDFHPIVQAVVGLAASALGILGSMVLARLNTKFHLDISAARQDAFDKALNKSLMYGATQATAEIAEKGWDHADTKSEVVATALNQAVSTFPEALAGVGLSTDLTDPKNAATLTAALERALPAAMTEASASPATPPTATQTAEAEAEAIVAPAATIHIVTTPPK